VLLGVHRRSRGSVGTPTTVPVIPVTAALRATVGSVGRRSAGSDDRRESHQSFFFVKLYDVSGTHAEVAAVERWWGRPAVLGRRPRGGLVGLGVAWRLTPHRTVTGPADQDADADEVERTAVFRGERGIDPGERMEVVGRLFVIGHGPRVVNGVPVPGWAEVRAEVRAEQE